MRKTNEENLQVRVENLLKTKRLPMVTLDVRWHKMFPPGKKTPDIMRAEENLTNLLKKQSKLDSDIKELKKLKKRLMDEIVYEMSTITNNDDIKRQRKMDKTQKLIADINSKLENAIDDESLMPNEIRRANEALILVGIKDIYLNFQSNEEYIENVNKWIGEMRIEIKKRLLLKQEKEELNTTIYTFLHDLLGKEFMEIYDDLHNKK